jgi:protein TonB
MAFPAVLFNYADRLARALFVSAGVHLVVLSTVIHAPRFERIEDARQPIEVVLVNAASPRAPDQADALAQVNLDGGGDVDTEHHLQSPLPASEVDAAASEPAPAADARASDQVARLEAETRQLMTQLKASAPPPPAPAAKPAPEETGQGDLAARSLEMARLEARISRQWDEYQKRPKKHFFRPRTSEYSFARYVEDWRLKIERVGNNNYPEEARTKKIYGTLMLSVEIRADGTVADIVVDRSSGSKVLDAAAIRIVELAAPYGAFSEDMKSKADVLSITRTWSFTRADQLVSMD